MRRSGLLHRNVIVTTLPAIESVHIRTIALDIAGAQPIIGV